MSGVQILLLVLVVYAIGFTTGTLTTGTLMLFCICGGI